MPQGFVILGLILLCLSSSGMMVLDSFKSCVTSDVIVCPWSDLVTLDSETEPTSRWTSLCAVHLHSPLALDVCPAARRSCLFGRTASSNRRVIETKPRTSVRDAQSPLSNRLCQTQVWACSQVVLDEHVRSRSHFGVTEQQFCFNVFGGECFVFLERT